MSKKKSKNIGLFFERLSGKITKFTGSTKAFITACTIIIIWGITGPLFHYSDTWQLVINTGTTIVTFLMVFLIQRSQNKESEVIQLKLNELIASIDSASNRLVDSEDLTEEEIDILHKYYQLLASKAKKERDIKKSHSIEEAVIKHESKESTRKK